MAIFDGLTSLKAAVNTVNANLAVSYIKFANPRSAKDTLFNLLGKNTIAQVNYQNSLTNASTTINGTTTVGYNRISLDTVSTKTIDVKVPINVTNITEALPYIAYRLGWYTLRPGDWINKSLEFTNDIATTTLEASTANIQFYGSLPIRLLKNRIYLGTLVLNPVLANTIYPSSDLTKGQAALLSYSCDPTSQAAQLASVVQGQSINQSLADMVSAITGVTWVTSGPGDYSLLGATVEYVGLVAGTDYPTKDGFTSVVVINLSASNCTNFAGTLYFHFN